MKSTRAERRSRSRVTPTLWDALQDLTANGDTRYPTTFVLETKPDRCKMGPNRTTSKQSGPVNP
ncbi:hypothetical protein L484_018306 [Morus notabilis]|uniref:Uncharacterized protein n=1 Tax=Morus notabilis TaxID=981085 RepID=W9SAR7_9ROSA|nr:hypothetical protein L484_018306 [Morus notabilis]